MLTLNQAKIELGIALPDTGSDTELSRVIRQVIARIRQQTMRGVAWVCDQIDSVASNAQLRVIGHGWRTGQIVKIVGSGITAVDDVHTITVINRDTIQLDVDGELSECEFTLHPKVTKDIVPTAQYRVWLPEQITPCLEIIEISDNVSEDEWTLLDSTAWFANNVAGQKVVQVERKDGIFLVPINIRRGQYGLRIRGIKETVRITVYEGSDVPPEEIVLAGLSLVCDVTDRQGSGKDESSFSFRGMSRSSMTGQERQEHILSATSVINSWVAR